MINQTPIHTWHPGERQATYDPEWFDEIEPVEQADYGVKVCSTEPHHKD